MCFFPDHYDCDAEVIGNSIDIRRGLFLEALPARQNKSMKPFEFTRRSFNNLEILRID